MKKVIAFIALALLLSPGATAAYAQPALPHAFYGSVTINGAQAPAGTSVEARGEGVATGIAGNPTITTVRGIYGTTNPFEARLVVQGDISPGATITFYVNGVSTGQTTEWLSSETTELPLSVTIAEEEGGLPPAARPTIETSLFGIEESFRISDDGEILETVTGTSEDGNLTITIPEGTIALDEDGEPLSGMTADVDPSPPDPPEGANIIGLAYDFGPAGATFEPPITLEYTYDPDEIPEGVAEADLVIAMWDEEAGEWVELPCTVDPVTNTITASVSHFTTFAIIARAPVPPPAPPPPPEVVPAPPPPPEVVPAAPPAPPPPPEEVPEVPVKAPINWTLIGGIIAAVVVVILLVYFLVVRRRAY